ncbi:glycosyltransferase family 2 protein [Saccharomonospora sp. NPDC046836]|uniref:glycosyltransferase family 2 protein n=1 Tax=Saccharomonospora sp. NPDC046836 TaxID=3156921 RepID=UPI0033DCC9B8
MIPTWLLILFICGINFTVWGTIGVLRLLERRVAPMAAAQAPSSGAPAGVRTGEVAVLMAAHNEEVVISESLAALGELVDPEAVYVVSDGSTDRTVELADAAGVNVTETPANVGKAGALEWGIRHFELAQRYQAVLLLDADTRLDPGYLAAALPLFDDPEVVAVAGCAVTDWRSSSSGFLARVLTAHRGRVYALMQRLVKFGQAWRRTNAVQIVPGFASLYRASVLPKLEINPPGLVIEDFNMTFEVYRRRLGKVGFTLAARAVTQDPDRFRDYVRQVKRWTLGFWQSVRRHRPRADLFSIALGAFIVELIIAGLVLVLLPVVLVLLVLAEVTAAVFTWPVIGDATQVVERYVSLNSLLLGVLLPDVVLTALVAAVERRPGYLLWAPLYLPLRVIDAAIALYTLPLALFRKSDGRWTSPTRREYIETPESAHSGRLLA